MPNIGTVLREEISRLSRKEVRSHVDPARKVTAQHRHDIAALKRQIAQLERQVALLSRKVLGTRPGISPDSAARPVRFSAKGLHAQRSRLKLSATDFGKLLGVSSQTIYNWEREAARPRSEQLGKLAALRAMGTREAKSRLEQMVGATGRSKA
jgi:DNA-binding transcriptional regulator YiaG